MKFFFPFAPETVQAERMYARIVARLNKMGYELTAERIYRVVYKRDGITVTETVGAVSANGEVVMAIFKNHIGYFICTYSCGAAGGEPMVARYSVTQSIELFNENEPAENEHAAS